MNACPPIPPGAVVWCERCHRWTRTGQPYEMTEPGKFRHRMCIVGTVR